jgi:Predicted GTPases
LPHLGTVIRRTKNFYYVDIGESEPKLCHIRANLFHGNPKTNLVAVGDQVEIETAHVGEAGWILKLLPRRTMLSRRQSVGSIEQVLASNVDKVLVVASISSPPFRNVLVDRFFVAGSCGGLENVLILSKADLSSEEEISSIKNLYLSPRL